ncbi:MAG: hypothetical protein JSS75_04230 [Bacteroidetes bacterium]|nr:hypothetical protein [Bacteroidota bacterium]
MKYPNHTSRTRWFAAIAVVGLLFSSLLSSCSDASFTPQIGEPPTQGPSPAPKWYHFSGGARMNVVCTLGMDYQYETLPSNARVVVAWETGFDSTNTPKFSFFGGATLSTYTQGGPSNDKYQFSLTLGDSVPSEAVYRQVHTGSATPDTATLAVGHVFLLANDAVTDGFVIDTVARHIDTLHVYSNLGAMVIVLRKGTIKPPSFTMFQDSLRDAKLTPSGYSLFSLQHQDHGPDYYGPWNPSDWTDIEAHDIKDKPSSDAGRFFLWLFK